MYEGEGGGKGVSHLPGGKSIAISRVMCVCVRMNYKAGRLISDRNTFSFREQ